jgi:hypothetical protein
MNSAPISELVFEVTQEADGGYVPECLTETIATQGDTWDELRASHAISAFQLQTTRC